MHAHIGCCMHAPMIARIGRCMHACTHAWLQSSCPAAPTPHLFRTLYPQKQQLFAAAFSAARLEALQHLDGVPRRSLRTALMHVHMRESDSCSGVDAATAALADPDAADGVMSWRLLAVFKPGSSKAAQARSIRSVEVQIRKKLGRAAITQGTQQPPRSYDT
eukprot:362879-Chlamydomonas_euryale.AAC.2